MKKYRHSGSSVFLMEIILDILLFSLLLVISLQVIIKAHTLTADTTQLHGAVTACTNIAGCFESGDGTLGSIRSVYSMAGGTDDRLFVYLDSNFAECKKADAVYVVSVSYVNDEASDNPRLTEVLVSCTRESKDIYEITACHYEPFSVSAGMGGA
jgi:hypothetical protein